MPISPLSRHSRFSRRGAGSVLGAAAALALVVPALSACEQPTKCGLIGMPQSDIGAFDIAATGTTCTTAGAIAIGSRNRVGKPYQSLDFTCPRAVPGPKQGLPSRTYTCTAHSGAKITFVATW